MYSCNSQKIVSQVFLIVFFKNPKFSLSIWWVHLVFGAEVIKILLDPDHLGHIEGKSRKIWWLRFFTPLAHVWPLLNVEAPKLAQSYSNICREFVNKKNWSRDLYFGPEGQIYGFLRSRDQILNFE